jgi:hypothetical protein
MKDLVLMAKASFRCYNFCPRLFHGNPCGEAGGNESDNIRGLQPLNYFYLN